MGMQSMGQQAPMQGGGKSSAGFNPSTQIQPPAGMPEPIAQQNSLPQQQQFQGKSGSTNAATSGQPQMGRPNNYRNTIQPWDNANIQPQRQAGGKGKGA